MTLRVLTVAAGCGAIVLSGCGGGQPASLEARQLTAEHRMALTDTIRGLSDSVMSAISAADPSPVTGYLRDGMDAAFGGAGGMFLSAETFRESIAQAHRAMRGYQVDVTEQRVSLLGVDGAVSTGWGNFVASDTAGTRARGVQAFTMAWARTETGWKVVQMHVSSRVSGIERPRNPEQPAQ